MFNLKHSLNIVTNQAINQLIRVFISLIIITLIYQIRGFSCLLHKRCITSIKNNLNITTTLNIIINQAKN
jgi:hypothetical protein